MKLRSVYITVGLLVFACMAFTSCVCEDETCIEGGEDSHALYVSFRLSMQHASSAATKSTRGVVPSDPGGGKWGDEYEKSEAIPFEETILKDRFHVTLYNAADKSCVGWLDNILCTQFVKSGSDDIYEFRGFLRLLKPETTVEELRRLTVRMMIVANQPDMPFGALRHDLQDIDDNPGDLRYYYIGQENDFHAIPMWGVCSASLKDIGPGPENRADMGSIALLRSMAKVEVRVNPNDGQLQDVHLESVTLNRANRSGFTLPGEWNTLDDTRNLEFGKTLRVPYSPGVITSKRFDKKSADGGIVFYLPECENTVGDEIVMTVAYTVGSDHRTNEIYFRPYNEVTGKPDSAPLWDIVRNHHYRYTIVGVGASHDDLRFKVSISDMEKGGDYVFDY